MVESKELVESLDSKNDVFEVADNLADMISMGEWVEFCYTVEN